MLLTVTLPERAMMSAAISTVGAVSLTCAPGANCSGALIEILLPVLMLKPPRPKLFSVGASNQAVLARSDGSAEVRPRLPETGATLPNVTLVL